MPVFNHASIIVILVVRVFHDQMPLCVSERGFQYAVIYCVTILFTHLNEIMHHYSLICHLITLF